MSSEIERPPLRLLLLGLFLLLLASIIMIIHIIIKITKAQGKSLVLLSFIGLLFLYSPASISIITSVPLSSPL